MPIEFGSVFSREKLYVNLELFDNILKTKRMLDGKETDAYV